MNVLHKSVRTENLETSHQTIYHMSRLYSVPHGVSFTLPWQNTLRKKKYADKSSPTQYKQRW